MDLKIHDGTFFTIQNSAINANINSGGYPGKAMLPAAVYFRRRHFFGAAEKRISIYSVKRISA